MTASLPDSLFRALVEQSGVPFVIIDDGGTVVHAGEQIRSIVGWAPADVVGRTIADFLEPHDFELALEGIAEISGAEQVASSVPVVVPIKGPTGASRHIEVAAVPLPDVGGRRLLALRLRSWEPQRHLSQFVRHLLAGASLTEVLEALSRSLAASMEGVGAAVHHGFDGTRFHGVAGSWPQAVDLPLAGSPWLDALAGDEVLQVAAAHPAAQSVGAVAGWLVPVRPASGPPAAVLSIWRDRPDAPYVGHRRAFVEAAEYVELALVRSAQHERLVHLARHDSLTGVGNRATFHDQLAAALARGESQLAVGFCDLDDFKRVNDELGHAIGDELLVQMAARIRGTLRSGDEIARMGGDEFTILWKGIADAAHAEAAAQRVLAAGAAPFEVAGLRVSVGISIGYVMASPGASAASLLAASDVALYRSKQEGGSRATAFTGV